MRFNPKQNAIKKLFVSFTSTRSLKSTMRDVNDFSMFLRCQRFDHTIVTLLNYIRSFPHFPWKRIYSVA